MTDAWVADVTGAEVLRSTALIGGMSSRVERHELDDRRAVVSRHITDRDWLTREPYLINAEATALRLLATSPLEAPLVIATDPPSGRLLMTFVSGQMQPSGTWLRDHVSALAQVAVDISRVELPTDHGLLPWRSWAPASLAAPTWGDQGLWNAGIAMFLATPEPVAPSPTLLHRDLHPLNILWSAHNEPAVVDWVNACVGHPHAELGHCRWNLAVLAGHDCANTFLASYRAGTGGGDYDRYWDLAPVMSMLPNGPGIEGWHSVGRTDLTSSIVIERTEAFLRAALE